MSGGKIKNWSLVVDKRPSKVSKNTKKPIKLWQHKNGMEVEIRHNQFGSDKYEIVAGSPNTEEKEANNLKTSNFDKAERYASEYMRKNEWGKFKNWLVVDEIRNKSPL